MSFMNNVGKILKIRYEKPLIALKDNYEIKLMISFLAWFWATILDVFYLDTQIIFLLLVAIAADWITGIWKAKREDIYIRSLGFRQSVVKVIEYFIFLFVLTGIANVFGKSDLQNWVGDIFRFLKNVNWFGAFYLIFTELKSISENIQGKKGAFYDIIQEINKRIFGTKDNDNVR